MTLASLREVHENFAWFVIIGNGLAGLWALAAHFREPLRTRALWWFTFVVELSVFVQVSLGVGMVAVLPADEVPPPPAVCQVACSSASNEV